MTQPTTSSVSRVLRALLGAVVVSIVLGIVGMHALNTHGVMSDAGHATMSSPSTGALGETSADLGTSEPVGVTETGAAGPVEENGHNMGGMVMLCVSMLVAAGATLLLLLVAVRRLHLFWADRPTAPATLASWFTARLGSGPPPVWDFSVIRR